MSSSWKPSFPSWPLLVLVACLIAESHEDRTSMKIYEPILGSSPCFKRLNGTHEVGCTSSLNGDVGVLHFVEDEGESLNWVVAEGPHSPYIALITPDTLTRNVMDKLKNSGRVAGVLVLNLTKEAAGGPPKKGFSPDMTCPNQGLGLYNQSDPLYCEDWNSEGQGILFERYDFPMFYVQNDKESQDILDYFNKFNRPENGSARDWPLCAAQLKSFMLAAVDTPTCLRRSDRFNIEQQTGRVCDAMGDLSIWASAVPSNQSNSNSKGSILITARLDATSLFEGRTRGADTAATGITALLAVVKHLSTQAELIANSLEVDNVYFMLFNGETYGYIGSSRIVYDMKNKNFPNGIKEDDADVVSNLNLDDIKYYIEFGQLGLTDANEPYFFHANPFSSTTEQKPLNDALLAEGKDANLILARSNKGLPPSSLQSFLRERKSIPAVVVTNFEKQYRNRFYNSLFDDDQQLLYNHGHHFSVVVGKIANLSAAVANTVVKLVSNEKVDSIKPDYSTVNDLLECYAVTSNCTLFQRLTDKLTDTPLDLYVGVKRPYYSSPSTQWTKLLMIYYQGTNVSTITKELACTLSKSKRNVFHIWINGTCYETTVNQTDAQSPAFIIPNYDWRSGVYSTWTESVWQKFMVRIFLKPSLAHEITTLVSGIVVFLVSFILIGWISSKSDVIFPARTNGMTC